MEKGLLGGIILGAGLVAGGLAAIYLFKQAGYYPLRLANTYQGSHWGGGDYVQPQSTMDILISVDSGSQHYLTNTIPPIDPMMFSDSADWLARRNKGARWYS